ncbi:YoaK family protein [Streptomyces sp. NPDC002225]|uniref:YoaK family protein n=1 Tax=Streptomyces sp. NPDC002225 TaxID=3154413 RepID=UPI0033166E97
MSTAVRPPVPRPDAAPGPWGEWPLLLLSAASGSADAFAFLCVGQVFAGVMTGNLVLLGISATGAGEHGVVIRVVTALLAYGAGVACGAWMEGRPKWPLPVMLLAEVALLATASALWALGPAGSAGGRTALLALTAVAMGIQGRIRSTPTNYFTGTLTGLVGRAALRSWGRGDLWVAGRLVAVAAGAAATAVTGHLWPGAAAAGAALLVENRHRVRFRHRDVPAGSREPGPDAPGRGRGDTPA